MKMVACIYISMLCLPSVLLVDVRAQDSTRVAAFQNLPKDSTVSVVHSDGIITIQNHSTRTRISSGTAPFPPSSDLTIENEISRLEAAERDALFNRDTISLKRLWALDFSNINAGANRVAFTAPSLPYYAVFVRIIESVSSRNGLVYVNGVDHTSVISRNNTIQPTAHKFIHTWRQFGSTWKMISKFPNDY